MQFTIKICENIELGLLDMGNDAILQLVDVLGEKYGFDTEEANIFLRKTYNKTIKSKKKNFGQNVKSRAGSSRNGLANTYANNNSKPTTEKQVKERNEDLGINPDICMYCNINPKKDDDHLIPQCCTKNSIYGQNNSLNRVPSCSQCNGKKGGKVNDELKLWLKDYCKWSTDKIHNLFKWINKNKDYLFIDEEGCNYLEDQYKYINMFHDISQKSCENKEDIMINLLKNIAQDEFLRDKAKQIISKN